MKLSILLLAFFFFVGFGAAFDLGGVLDEALSPIHSLTTNSGGNNAQGVNADEDLQTELGKKLKEQLDNLQEKLKDSNYKGKEIKQELLDKAKETQKKLKDLKVDILEKSGSKSSES